MSKYAVVEILGFQYFVTLGQKFQVNRLLAKEGDIIDLPQIYLIRDNDKIDIGKPILNIPLKAQVIKHFKGEKIEVYKYKSKVRYRRHIGFRPYLSEIQIVQFGVDKFNEATNTKEDIDIKNAKQPVKSKEIKIPLKKVKKTNLKSKSPRLKPKTIK